jgi:hypothetical protein
MVFRLSLGKLLGSLAASRTGIGILVVCFVFLMSTLRFVSSIFLSPLSFTEDFLFDTLFYISSALVD